MMLFVSAWRQEQLIALNQELIDMHTELLETYGQVIKTNSGSIKTNAGSINMGTKILDAQFRTIKNLHGLK